MARPITFVTGQWADLPLEELAKKASSWGYDGLELACWGDHFEVDKALDDDGYCKAKHKQLEKYGFTGSSIWHLVYSFPPASPDMIQAGYEDFARRWRWYSGRIRWPHGVRRPTPLLGLPLARAW